MVISRLSVDSWYNTTNMSDDKTSIQRTAKRLRSARLAKGLTQVVVAKKSGVSISYYAQVERGEVNPTASKLLKIIYALDVESKDILGK